MARTAQRHGTAEIASRQHDLSNVERRILILIDGQRRLADLPKMIDAFDAIVADHRGEVTAKVTSAHPLTPAQLTELTANLKSRVGRDVTVAAL